MAKLKLLVKVANEGASFVIPPIIDTRPELKIAEKIPKIILKPYIL